MRVTLLLLFLLLLRVDPWAGESLFVFFPSPVRPQILQKRISAINPSVAVTAFAKFADFQEEVTLNPPDAVLTLPEVIQTLDGYSLTIGGKKNGLKAESYFLLSLDQGIDLAQIDKSTIGIADFLGRKGMKSFISGMFQPPPAIKTVAKIEDLLPMLTFKMVNGILVTETQLAYFQGISKLEFVKTLVPHVKSGTISLAVKGGQEVPKIMRTLKAIDGDLQMLMGGIQWN